MSKEDFIVVLLIECLLFLMFLAAAFVGTFVVNTTTPWFWFTVSTIMLVILIFKFIKYKKLIEN